MSDRKVLILEIVREYWGLYCDRYIGKYVCDRWLKLFPLIKSGLTFATKQAADLRSYKQQLRQQLAGNLAAFKDSIHLIDDFEFVCSKTKNKKAQF